MCTGNRKALSQTQPVPEYNGPISTSGKVNGDQIANLLKQVQVGNRDKVILAIREMTNLTMTEVRELVSTFFNEEGSFINA